MDTKFSVAVHTLVMFSETEEQLTSEKIANSVNTNASYIRKIIALLKKADLLIRHKGSFNYFLGKAKDEMTLLDIYKAVQQEEHVKVIYTHQQANQACPVGSTINKVLDPIVEHAERQLEMDLASQTLADVIARIGQEWEKR